MKLHSHSLLCVFRSGKPIPRNGSHSAGSCLFLFHPCTLVQTNQILLLRPMHPLVYHIGDPSLHTHETLSVSTAGYMVHRTVAEAASHVHVHPFIVCTCASIHRMHMH